MHDLKRFQTRSDATVLLGITAVAVFYALTDVVSHCRPMGDL